ncbi:FkbM family methyltransferase [Kitasatospora sp. NPDC101183]|uniref:FkbM family methyltransferase n=1 Tax=Kitasatospora sp. NPDC101183 TaxID=3364100 RepID=UPI0037F7FCE5
MTVFMFPGLGDHYLDMGRDLYRDHPVFRTELDRCAELLEPELGLDLRSVLFSEEASRDEAPELDLRRMLGRGEPEESEQERRLNRTEVAQPALFAVEYALAKLWASWGVEPEAMIGYSLGEYVAACLAGVLSLEDSLTLVARRAKLIEAAPTGRMLAVMLSEEKLGGLLGERLSLSAVNGPEFCVVAGPAEDVEALQERLRGEGVVVRPVRSTHAFHSAMMRPLVEQVTALAEGLTLSAPRIPYVSNVTGTWITDAQATDPGYWAQHLISPVRFADGLREFGAERTLLEAGPGQTLSSLATGARGSGAGVVASMRHPLESRDDTEVLREALAKLNGEKAGNNDAELTGTERTLAELWVKLLPVDEIPVDVSFFEVGGNSLLATRLLLRVTRAFGVELTLRQVYETPTVAKMAAVIDALRSGEEVSTEAATSETGSAERPRFQLPNGLWITHQNESETKHFYEDIFDHRTYAKHGITIEDGATVVDVGGNIGLFTLFAHYEAKDVKVYTFEPAPPMFELLGRNVADHGVNATLIHAGASDAEGTAEFTFYPRSSGMSSFHPDEAEEKHNLRTIIANQREAGEAEAVEEIDQLAAYAEELMDVRFEAIPFTATLRPLSAVIREQGIERIDLIKIDVQKSEQQVIDGIADEDWPKIRQMVLEAHDGDGRVARLTELLAGHGFSVLAEQDELYRGTDIFNIYATRGEAK